MRIQEIHRKVSLVQLNWAIYKYFFLPISFTFHWFLYNLQTALTYSQFLHCFKIFDILVGSVDIVFLGFYKLNIGFGDFNIVVRHFMTKHRSWKYWSKYAVMIIPTLLFFCCLTLGGSLHYTTLCHLAKYFFKLLFRLLMTFYSLY